MKTLLWIILVLCCAILFINLFNPHFEEVESFDKIILHDRYFSNTMEFFSKSTSFICDNNVEITTFITIDSVWAELKDDKKRGVCYELVKKTRLILGDS